MRFPSKTLVVMATAAAGYFAAQTVELVPIDNTIAVKLVEVIESDAASHYVELINVSRTLERTNITIEITAPGNGKFAKIGDTCGTLRYLTPSQPTPPPIDCPTQEAVVFPSIALPAGATVRAIVQYQMAGSPSFLIKGAEELYTIEGPGFLFWLAENRDWVVLGGLVVFVLLAIGFAVGEVVSKQESEASGGG